MTAEILYNDYHKMICDRAWSFHSSTGIEFDELISVSNYLFMKAFNSWDKSKSSFSTYLFICLNNGLIMFIKKNSNLVELEDAHLIESPYREHYPDIALMAKDALNELSEEARFVVNILLSTPAEILSIIGTEPPKMIRGKIRDHLKEQGWASPAIWRVFKEIKSFVKA